MSTLGFSFATSPSADLSSIMALRAAAALVGVRVPLVVFAYVAEPASAGFSLCDAWKSASPSRHVLLPVSTVITSLSGWRTNLLAPLRTREIACAMVPVRSSSTSVRRTA